MFEEQNPCKSSFYENEKKSFESFPTEAYSNFMELKKDFYRLYWNVTDTKIKIEVHVKTKGWISFGFSQTDGNIFNSDVFIGWIGDDGISNFSVNFKFYKPVFIPWSLPFHECHVSKPLPHRDRPLTSPLLKIKRLMCS